MPEVRRPLVCETPGSTLALTHYQVKSDFYLYNKVHLDDNNI